MTTIATFTPPYKDLEPAGQADMQALINQHVYRLTEDTKKLIELLNDYEDQYKPLPYRVLGTLEQLSVILRHAAQGQQDSVTMGLCRRCDERYDAARHEQDDAWQMRQYATDSIAGGHAK